MASLFWGCSPSEKSRVPDDFDSWYELRVGSAVVTVQVALRASEMAVGLMGRESLPAGSGMLFLYPEPREMSFWMRNTPLPLDIAFIDQGGVLQEIRRMYPYDETPVRSASKALIGALEMERGEMERLGIRSGSKVDAEGLREILERRGVNADLYLFP
ncbi:MAG: DUF192 domain-containing protein [Puniceicoccaceae bacterium]